MIHYKAIKINGVKKDLHRHIVEQYLGRKLSYNRVVHHKDGNKLNNDPDNFEILTRAQHARLHQIGKKLPVSTVTKIIEAKRKARIGAKLTVEQVKIVKEMLQLGHRQSDIAKAFNVSKFCIHKIKSGRNSHWIIPDA